MDVKISQTTIKKNNFVPRKISKKIINNINFDKDYKNQKQIEMSRYITLDKLHDIRKKFQYYKKRKKPHGPRNSLLYKFIKHNNPKLNFNYNSNESNIIIPEFNGVRLSLSTLLLNSLDEKDNKIKKKIVFLNDFKQILKSCNFKKPSLKSLESFANLVHKIKRNNKTLHIFTPACPDYSTVYEGKMYRYTFDNIGNNIGLVAERLKKDIVKIHNFFHNHNIKFKHIISVGDFEAFSKTNQKRLKLSEKEYLKKINVNQQEIIKNFKYKNCSLDKVFTDYFSGKSQWQRLINKYTKILKDEEYGNSDLNRQKFEQILRSRIPLYRKWYGDIGMGGYSKILINQAAEYASMGHLISKKYANVIILGADHFKMSPFYCIGEKKSATQSLPVFYLRKNYLING